MCVTLLWALHIVIKQQFFYIYFYITHYIRIYMHCCRPTSVYISVRLWPSRRGYTGSRESVTIWSKGEAMLLAPHFFPDNVLTTSVPVDKSMLLRRRLSSWFGIHGTALNWFRSYLSSRCFRVKCNNDFSSSHTCLCGSPPRLSSRPSALCDVYYPTQYSCFISFFKSPPICR